MGEGKIARQKTVHMLIIHQLACSNKEINKIGVLSTGSHRLINKMGVLSTGSHRLCSQKHLY